MPVRVEEELQSFHYTETAAGKALVRSWKVHGMDNGVVACSAPGIPARGATYGADLKVVKLDGKMISFIAPGHERNLAVVQVDYSDQETPEETSGSEIVSFDTSAQTAHIEKAISQEIWNAAEQHFTQVAANGDECLIGQTDQGVQGTDIYVPTFTWNVRHFFLPATITNAYIGTLVDMTTKVNDDSWRGFDEGEVLFLGATCYDTARTPTVEVFFKFAARGGESVKLPLGGTTTPEGQDYVWRQYRPLVSTVSGNKGWTTEALVVSKVYKKDDFSRIGIGV